MDQVYIEDGYIDASYYGIVAEAEAILGGAFTPSFTVDIADPSGYYIPDYIENGYYEPPGAIVEFSADLVSDTTVEAVAGKVLEATADFAAFGTATLTAAALKNHTAILDVQTDMLSTVSKIASNSVTLDSIINQSLQSDRLRDFDSASLASFDINIAPGLLRDSGALSSNATTTFTANAFRVTDITTTLPSVFSVSLSNEVIVIQDADLASEFALTAIGNVDNIASSEMNTSSSMTVATNNTVITNSDLTAQFTVNCDAELIKEPMLLGAWMNTDNVYQGIRIVQDRLNNIYALGRAANNISDFHNVLIVKTDAIGEIIWQNTYSQLFKYADYAELLTEGDNIYLVAGTWGSLDGNIDDDTQVFKISGVTGEILQKTRFNDLGCKSATLYNDNLYLYGGSTNNTYEINVLSISTADLTQINWQKTIDEIGTDTLYLFTEIPGNIAANSNGVYVITKAVSSLGSGLNYTLLFKLDVDTGNLLLTKKSAANVTPYDIEVDSQGNVIASMRYVTAERIVKFNQDLTFIWARDVGTTGTELRISVDGADNIAVLRTSLGKVVVIDTDGDLVSRTSIEGNYSDIFAKDEWLLTVGDGYWTTGAVQSSYEYLRNIWIAQTQSSGEGAPVTAFESYAGADGVWTYSNTADDISSASATFSVDTDWFIVNSNIITSTLNSVVTATEYPWKILGRIVLGNAIIDSTVGLTADILRIRSTSVNQNATIQQSTTAAKTTTTSSVFETTVAQTATAVKTARVIANVQARSTINIETANSRIRYNSAALAVDNQVDILYGEITKSPGATLLDTNVVLTAANSRTRDISVSTDSIAIEIAVVAKTGNFLINLENQTVQSTVAAKTTDVDSAMQSTTVVDAGVIKAVDAVVSIAADTTLTVGVDKIKAVGAECVSTFTQATVAAKITNTNSAMECAVTQQIAAKRIRFGTVGLNTTTAVVCAPKLVKFGSAALASEAIGLFILNKIVRTQANLEVQGFTLSAGRVIQIDEYYKLIVPQELRRIKILEESRTVQVDEETRVELI